MKRKALVIILNLIWLTIPCLYAQLTLSDRVEIAKERNRYDDDVEVVSLKHNGLILIQVEKPWKYEDPKPHTLSFIDTSLQTVREIVLDLPYDFAEQRFTYFDQDKYLYFFYQDEAKYDIKVVRLNIYKSEYRLYEFKPPVKLNIDDFRATSDQAFFTGTLNSKRVIVKYSFVEERASVLPSFYNKNETLLSIQPDSASKEIYFNILGRNARDCKFRVKSYSNLIGTVTDYDIQNRSTQTAREGIVYVQNPRYKSIIGLYSENCSKNLQGLFIADFDGNQQENIRFKPFVEFSNFFNYYNENKAARLREKVEKKRSKGKKINLFRKFVLGDQFYPKGDELVLLIEGYYSAYNGEFNPRSRNIYRANTRYSLTGATIPNNNAYYTNQFNTSYVNQFNYAILCGFDRNGRLLWDNVIDVESVEQDGLDAVVQVGHLGDSVTLAYQYEEKFYSKMIHRFKTIKEETEQEMEELFPDKISTTHWGNMIHWYDNKYLYFGEQGLKNKVISLDAPSPRVFHLTKLAYYPQEEEIAEDKKTKKESNK